MANKTDEKQIVPAKDGQEFAEKAGMHFCEVSAKNGVGIENLFIEQA